MLLWLKEQFEACRGGSLQTFARFMWQGVKQNDGTRLVQPVFTMSDSYMKAHMLTASTGVTKAAGLAGTEPLQPCEEINFSKIALRFSASLNKDTVFTCSRHLLAALGDAMRCQEVTIDWGIGEGGHAPGAVCVWGGAVARVRVRAEGGGACSRCCVCVWGGQ